MRLNKYLASRNYASRRGADKLIEEGAVTINGKVAEMGQQVDLEKDIVEVNQQILDKKQEALRYFLLNKPVGVTCSTKKTKDDPNIILDYFTEEKTGEKKFPKIYPVGRLDKDSCGLVLLTNDGDVTFELTHPSKEHEKEYFVEIWNPLTDDMLERLQRPFHMLGQKTRRAHVEKTGMYTFLITLQEGKNRQIRRMVRAIGSGVKILQRVRINHLELPHNLKEGEWVEVKYEDIM